MATIPASHYVPVLPGVVSAGGQALVLNGLFLTNSWRVPIGTIQSSVSAPSVASFFGSTSAEYAAATTYFNGYLNGTQLPGSILFTQYPVSSVAAWMRSGNVTAIGLATLQQMNGSLTVSVDGYPHVAASLNLSSATSYSAAAALIAAGFTNPTEAVVTGSVATTTDSFTGSINDDVLTVTGTVTGTIVVGTTLAATGITAGTEVIQQLTGVTGGVGTYLLNTGGMNVASTTIAGSYGTMTVTAMTSGTLSIGQVVTGGTIPGNTIIVGLGTGTGLTGTYFLSASFTQTSTTITAAAVAPTVTFDSQSGSFVITSGITGGASSVAYATGTLASSLLFTSATGAILSQGAAAATPASFMNQVIQVTQNWATFTTVFDPDFSIGNIQKLAFAAWTNNQNSRYAYCCWDTDQSPLAAAPASQSLGYLIGLTGNNYTGTALFSTPTGGTCVYAAFAMGFAASLNFGATNGRATLAFKGQNGITASVSTLQAAANCEANLYNYYGAVATANQNFLFMYPGAISGPFLWYDSYINQIWLNNQLQLAIMNLFTNVPSIPYNQAGYALIEAAVQDPINQAVNFGAIRAGVTLSQGQISQINNQAGFAIDYTLSQRGWYFLVQNPTAQVRAARQSPPCFLWYMDGQSVQQLTLNSLDVL